VFNQARAILWAQWRGLLNYYPRSLRSGSMFSAVLMSIWYIMVLFGAWAVYSVLSEINDVQRVRDFLNRALFFATIYWQFVPVVLATTGLSLDLRKLIVYPIPHNQLYLLELLLRMSTSIEVLLVTCGAALGVLMNPKLPFWCAFAFVPFAVFNLALSAGVTEIQKRIFARKYLREAAVLCVVLLGAIPQLLFTTSLGAKVKIWYDVLPSFPTPWNSTALLATAASGPALSPLLAMAAWVAVAWWFGRNQFERGLRFDADASEASARASVVTDTHWSERLYRLPAALLPDPIAALVEKELRSLARSPRFRLVFFMGFSFGLLIWLPMASQDRSLIHGEMSGTSFGSENFLTLVSGYALLLLGEVCFLNSFGFDRGAAQAYWVFPITFKQGLISKNIAAMCFILLEVTVITLACYLVGMHVGLLKILQAFLVCLTMALFLMAIGNLTSVRNPRPVNPNRSMRSTPAGKTQAMLLVIYPVAGFPIALAYLAEYAFETPWAFYGVMLFNLLIATIVYLVAMDSAVETADARREGIVTALSQGEGPVSV
jgi:ABC-2 type transport system permease protein